MNPCTIILLALVVTITMIIAANAASSLFKEDSSKIPTQKFYKEQKDSSSATCAYACLYDSDCKLFAHEAKKTLCQLYSKLPSGGGGGSAKPGWQYFPKKLMRG